MPKLVRVAKSGRRIVGIDGCALACVRQCLARHDVQPAVYHLLSDHGVRKRYQADFDPDEAAELLERIAAGLAVAEATADQSPRLEPVKRLRLRTGKTPYGEP